MENSSYLGTERPGVLLRRFAVPCIFSLIISCLYNIVDQIFVGNGVGYLGNAATGVIFPITVVGWGLSLFFGDGAAPSMQERSKTRRNLSSISVIFNKFPLTNGRIWVKLILPYVGPSGHRTAARCAEPFAPQLHTPSNRADRLPLAGVVCRHIHPDLLL